MRKTVGKSREAPPRSHSSLFLPCRSNFGVWLPAVQLSEQLACHSHKEKRLSHGSNILLSLDLRPSTAQKKAQHRPDTALAKGIPACRTDTREQQLRSCSFRRPAYHAIPTLRKRKCSPAADKINISCF